MVAKEPRPSHSEIVRFVQEWKAAPEEPVLADNEITIQLLQDISNYGYEWSKRTLGEMVKAGVCRVEKRSVRSGIRNVYIFPNKLPKF
jgi:hypothetical protein